MAFILNLLTLLRNLLELINPPRDPQPAPIDIPDAEDPNKGILLSMHNKARFDNGRLSLSYNIHLDNAAQKHAQWMADNNTFSHTGEYGSKVGERATMWGYDWSWVGENIAKGFTMPEETMRAWLESSGHRKNILNTRFTDMGVGIAASEHSTYWVVVFGSPAPKNRMLRSLVLRSNSKKKGR